MSIWSKLKWWGKILQVISFVNQKGGVGKSALAASFALILSGQGHRVLLIDSDPQRSSTYSFGLLASKKNVTYVYLGESIVSQSVEVAPNLWVVPADRKLRNQGNAMENTIKRALVNLNHVYDYVIIDTPGTINNLMRNAVKAADIIVIPCTVDELSPEATADTILDIQQMEFTGKIGVVLNKWKPAKNESPNIWANVQTKKVMATPVSLSDSYQTVLGNMILGTHVPKLDSLERMIADRAKAPRGKAREVLENLIKEVLC